MTEVLATSLTPQRVSRADYSAAGCVDGEALMGAWLKGCLETTDTYSVNYAE